MSHESSVFISSIIEEWPREELTPEGKDAFLTRLSALPVGQSAKAKAILHWELQTHTVVTPLERATAMGYSPGSVAKTEKLLRETGEFRPKPWKNQATRERVGWKG